jgi:hypothetical protein
MQFLVSSRAEGKVFTDKLRYYVYCDDARRIGDNRVSIATATVAAFVLLLTGQPEQSAAVGGLVVLAVSMCFFTLFSVESEAAGSGSRQSRNTFVYRSFSWQILVFSAIVCVVAVAIPQLATAALEKKIRAITSKGTLDKTAVEELSETFLTANTYGLRLPDRAARPALQAATTFTSQSTTRIGLPAVMNGKAFNSLPEASGSTWKMSPIATNSGPDNYSTIGFARFPYFARMESIGQPIVEPSSVGPAILLVKGLSANLDGFYLQNVVFQNMQLTYHGGPLILKNVYFVDCEFRVDSSKGSWELLSAISKSKDGWVTFSTDTTK